MESKSISGTSGTLAQEMNSGYIYTRLLRTPDANMERGSRSTENLVDRYLVRKMPLCLNDQLAMINKGLLPTPTTQEVEHPTSEITDSGRRLAKNKNSHSLGIADTIALMATPTGSMATMQDFVQAKFHSSKRPKYSDAMLPTPTGCDHKSRGPNSKQVGIDNFFKLLPTPRAGNPGSRPNQKGGKILAEEIQKAGMLPTPKSRDWKGGMGTKERQSPDLDKVILGSEGGMKLQPAFVEWMMGFPLGWTDLTADVLPEQEYTWNDGWYEVATALCLGGGKTPDRANRLKLLGNAIVPAVAFEIFKGIMDIEGEIE